MIDVRPLMNSYFCLSPKKNYRIVTSLERTLAAGAWDETRRRRNHAESTESRTFFGLRDPACIDEPQRDRIIKAFP